MSDRTDSPPLRWFLGDPKQRRQAWRYWVYDTLIGQFNMMVHYILRLLPVDWCSAYGAMMSRFYASHYPASDARARATWIRLRPDAADPVSVDAAMRRLWRSVCRTVAEYSVLDRLWGQGRITIEGLDHLDRARAADRPLLLLGLHLGNWDIMPVAGVAMGLSGDRTGFYLVPNNRYDDRIIIRARRRCNYNAIPASKANTRIVMQKLKGPNGFFEIYVDEAMRGRVFAPAFGRGLRPEGNIAYAARLAVKTDAIVMPTCAVRIGDSARFKLTFLPPVEMVKSSNSDADLMANIANINAVIEPVIRENLDQWYYLLDFEFDD